jgi:hypothetical protein
LLELGDQPLNDGVGKTALALGRLARSEEHRDRGELFGERRPALLGWTVETLGSGMTE